MKQRLMAKMANSLTIISPSKEGSLYSAAMEWGAHHLGWQVEAWSRSPIRSEGDSGCGQVQPSFWLNPTPCSCFRESLRRDAGTGSLTLAGAHAGGRAACGQSADSICCGARASSSLWREWDFPAGCGACVWPL